MLWCKHKRCMKSAKVAASDISNNVFPIVHMLWVVACSVSGSILLYLYIIFWQIAILYAKIRSERKQKFVHVILQNSCSQWVTPKIYEQQASPIWVVKLYRRTILSTFCTVPRRECCLCWGCPHTVCTIKIAKQSGKGKCKLTGTTLSSCNSHWSIKPRFMSSDDKYLSFTHSFTITILISTSNQINFIFLQILN